MLSRARPTTSSIAVRYDDVVPEETAAGSKQPFEQSAVAVFLREQDRTVHRVDDV